MLGLSPIGGAPIGAPFYFTQTSPTLPPAGGINVAEIPPSRRVIFEGSLRVVVFEGSQRVVIFDGSDNPAGQT